MSIIAENLELKLHDNDTVSRLCYSNVVKPDFTYNKKSHHTQINIL